MLWLTGNRSHRKITPTYLLPAYASGKITVPSMFDPFMVFAFYNIMIPLTIDGLLCGNEVQDTFSFPIPSHFLNGDLGELVQYIYIISYQY